MMRGGNTEATLVVADGPIESPPTVGRDVVGDRDAPRLLEAHARPAAPRQRGARELLGVRAAASTAGPVRVVEVPATDLAVDARQHHDRVDGDGRRLRRGHRARRRSIRSSTRSRPSLPVVPRAARRSSTGDALARRLRRPRPAIVPACARAGERCARVTAGRRVLTRGTVVIDVEACKGCDLCIDACPPRVLVMTHARASTAAATGTRCCCPAAPGARRARRSAPTSCSRSTSTTRRSSSRCNRPRNRRDHLRRDQRTHPAAARGLRGDRRGDGRRRVPVLRRLPDDAVHRGARAHGRASCRGRRRVHERRERARGDRHGVGRRGHRHAARPPAPPGRGSR